MSNTADAIYARMKQRLYNPASTMPGSFTQDNLGAVANELGRLYSEAYDQLIIRAHISTAEGDDLDVAARENHRMERREASYEEVMLTITGVPGTVIGTNVTVISESGIVFGITEKTIIGSDGSANVAARSQIPGAGCAVEARTITEFLTGHENLTSVINDEASSGGYDRESDEEFRARIQESEKEVVGYGNTAWYRKTAREVSGVSKAKAIDTARGLGTVDVVIIANNNQPASDVLVQRVTDHIEEERIVGADVLVYSGTAVQIDVTADIFLQSSYLVSRVQQDFLAGLNDYLEGIEFEDATTARVSYARIMDILLNCNGVTDVNSLMINGVAASLVLKIEEFPVSGNIAITAKELPV